MNILALESTCDETAAAVVEDGRIVRSSVVASQVELHAKYRGVVPEIASRAHIENLLPVLREAIDKSGVYLSDIDAVAVTHRPGLIGSLLIGVTAAKTLAWSLAKPLIGVDHVHAHLYSVMLEEGTEGKWTRGQGDKERGKDEGGRMKDEGETTSEKREAGNEKELSTFNFQLSTPRSALSTQHSSPAFPAVGLVVSGGHTALYQINDWLDVRLIGTTIDDAVGEAYDKVAALLGLGYPGGPILDRLAQSGDPAAAQFPRSLLGRDSLDFSFSGLKTSVLYHVHGVPSKHHHVPESPPALSEQQLADIAASFQAACVDVLIRKLKRAIRKVGAKSVIVGGGVSANKGLRAALSNLSQPAFVPQFVYCTDNAAMSAGLGYLHLNAGRQSPLDLDAITSSLFAEQLK